MKFSVLSPIDWLSIISSISSIALAVLALWLSLRFFFSTNKSEKEVGKILTEIRTQTDLMQKVTARMLNKYVTFSTTRQPDQSDFLMRLIATNSKGAGLVDDQAKFTNEEVLGSLTELYIAVAYHSALTNMVFQESVTEDITQLSQQVENILTITNHDFTTSMNWVDKHGGDYINKTSTSGYYQEIQELELAKYVCPPIEAVQRKANTTD